MSQIGFYYNMKVCTECKTCQVACKDKNNLNVGALFRRVYTMEGGKYPKPWVYNLSISCNHCANPKCVFNCPTGALYKRAEDGVVLHDKGKCIGCKLCIWSCPYEAPQYLEEESIIGKCDFCADLLAQGEDPACVASCVMRALHWGDLEELRRKYGDTADVKQFPSSDITDPSIVITPKLEAMK